MNERRFGVAVVLLVGSLPAQEQPGRDAEAIGARLDAFLTPLVEARQIAGCVLVARGERVLVRRAYGMADLEHGVPNTFRTRFCIASVSKPITGLALARLEADGRLEQTDPISKWIPDFPKGDSISLEMLRGHRAGVPHRVTTPEQETRPFTPAEVVELVKQKGLLFEPGTDRRYSSAGYAVLAYVIEQVTGKPFDAAMRELVFEPAGMRDTVHADHRTVLQNRARSYTPGLDGLSNAPLKDLSFLAGGGSFYSTVDDLHRLVVAYEKGRILPAAIVARTRGFLRGRWNGITNGFVAFVQFEDLDGDGDGDGDGGGEGDGRGEGDDAGVQLRVYFTGNVYTGAYVQLQDAILSILTGEGFAVPEVREMPKPVPVDPSVLASHVGDYTLLGRTTLRVRLQAGHLYCSDTILIPLAADRFFAPLRYAEVRFVAGDGGSIERLDWQEGGQTWACPREGR